MMPIAEATARGEAAGGDARRLAAGRSFAEALRREQRVGAARGGPSGSQLPSGAGEGVEEPGRGASPPVTLAGPSELPGTPERSGGAAAARAAEVGLALRCADRLQVEIAAGAELRYGLSLTPGGVEIQARASPALERVARADLHAVADRLRRQGIRVARAALEPRLPGRRGAGRRR